MKAYDLIDTPIEEIDDLYIGVVEFRTTDPDKMAEYIKEMGDPEVDHLYSVEVYESDEAFRHLGKSEYIRPSDFIAARSS